MARAEALQQQLAELERAAQKLSSTSSASHAQQQQHPVLPHQLLVDGAVISTRAGVRVVVGPVVGKVDYSSVRILVEVDTDALVTCYISILSTLSDEMHELSQCQLSVRCAAGRPMAFHINHLLPGRDYKFAFGGIDKQDVQTRSGGFRTPSLEASSSTHAVTVSGNNLYDLERCEANLWRDVKQLVAQKQALLVVHLGGQVVMKRMFDQSCALLMRHASVTSKTPNWLEIEAQAMEILRSAYRTQWNAMPELQFVLAHASNLMIWSDMDVYPAFTTRREFYIDHEKPTIQMQVIRTVTRCARWLYHEYQRQLWDDHMDELYQREKELFGVAEKALASTAQIYQLSQQIPLVQSDLELQKKRHEIEGARRVEKHLRALEAEKAKAEKQLVSHNQLLAPQRGEEFVYCIGEIGFLFLDMRSTRLEPGGAQAAENDLMSNLQWEFVEKSLESSSKIQLWIVCSELPVVDEIVASEELVATSNDSTLKVNPELQSWWGRNPEAQARLLEMLFDWKMQQSNHEFVLLSGTSSLRFGGKSSVRDTKMRTKADQYIVGAITASSHGENGFTSRRTWTIHERFEVEHSEIIPEKAFVTLNLDTSSASTSSSAAAASTRSLNTVVSGKNQIQIRQISTRHHAHEMAKVLLGPVVGFVDDSSAVVLFEVDRDVDVICVITNPLTGEMRKLYQHFKAKTPNSFFWTHLRSEHYYQISFANIQNAHEFQASFSTVARFPSRLEVLAFCHDDLLSAVPSGGLGSQRGNNDGSDQDTTTLLWDSVADKSVNVPFASVNLTIHLGGQFCVKTNVFIDEALALADTTTKVASNQVDESSNAEMVIEKLRQMYRLTWNLPGVRETLAHGAHIMLSNRQDELGLANSSASDLTVRDLLDRVHQEYQNLLLPPSKRVRLGIKASSTLERAKKPLSHVFGAFGVFFVPIGDFGGVAVHSATWDALKSFLSSPSVSVLILVTQELIVEDSLEDVVEKARFDAAYKSKFGFYQRELIRLLELLFEWKRSASGFGGVQTREVVFLSGSSRRSFDSVIQEVVSLPVLKASPRLEEAQVLNPGSRASRVILQYVVGPMTSRRTSSSIAETLERTVFPQGTLFNKYSYHHFFAKKAWETVPQEQSEAVPSDGAGVNPLDTATGNERNQSSDVSEVLASSQLAHLMISIGEEGEEEPSKPILSQQPLSDSTKPVPVVTKWSIICADPAKLHRSNDEDDSTFDRELEERYRREGRIESYQVGRAVNTWKLHPAQPSWLDELLSEALNEEESAQVETLTVYFQDKEQAIKDSFDQVAALKAGLVTLSDSRSFVPPLTEALTAFYSLSGSAFRAIVGANVPSPFVISYTIEQLQRSAAAAGGDQKLMVAAGCVDTELYQLLVEKCVANSMVFQQRLEKQWGW